MVVKQLQEIANYPDKVCWRLAERYGFLRPHHRRVESAGLESEIDYVLQHTTDAEEGGRQRTDAVVKLPKGRRLIIYSKTSWSRILPSRTPKTRGNGRCSQTPIPNC